MKKNLKKNSINSNNFFLQLKKGIPSPIFLFMGEEEGEKKRAIKELSKVFYSGLKEEPTIQQFFCQKNASEGDDIVKAAEYALSQSMFSSKKIVVLFNVNNLSNKRDLLILHEIIEDLPSDTLLIMTTVDNKMPGIFGKNGLADKIYPVIFWRPFENEIARYIPEKLKKSGKDIDHSAVTRLISLTGRDMAKVNEAIEKIIQGSNESFIDEENVVRLIADEREVSVFEFIEALFCKSKNSIFLLQKVVDEGIHELVALSLIQKELERIEKYHDLNKKGIPNDAIVKDLRIPYKGIDSFVSRTRKFQPKDLKRIFPFIYRADMNCKSEYNAKSILDNPLFDLLIEIIR